MFMLRNTDTVPHLAVFSCVANIASNMSLHHISSDSISMIKEGFKLLADDLHVLITYTLHRFHKRSEASFYNHVLEQLGSSHADNLTIY